MSQPSPLEQILRQWLSEQYNFLPTDNSVQALEFAISTWLITETAHLEGRLQKAVNGLRTVYTDSLKALSAGLPGAEIPAMAARQVLESLGAIEKLDPAGPKIVSVSPPVQVDISWR